MFSVHENPYKIIMQIELEIPLFSKLKHFKGIALIKISI